MKKIEFEPCKQRYSLTQGVYVVTLDDRFEVICNSERLLREWLSTLASYNEASRVKIWLCGLDDWDKDEITYLVAQDMQGDYDSYEEWAEWHGPSTFMEYWFDEATSRRYDEDFTRRYRRWKEINAAPTAVISLINASPVASSSMKKVG